MLNGAGSLSVGGSRRVNDLVRAVLSSDPWAEDGRAIRSDFVYALDSIDPAAHSS